MSESEKVRAFAILVDPSGTGDRKKDDELREKSCATCGYPSAQGGDYCEKCAAVERGRQRQWMYDFNEFMLGTPHPVHVYGVGFLNPKNPSHRRYFGDD